MCAVSGSGMTSVCMEGGKIGSACMEGEWDEKCVKGVIVG